MNLNMKAPYGVLKLIHYTGKRRKLATHRVRLQRLQKRLALHALVAGNGAKDGVQGSDAKSLVRGHCDALVSGSVSFKHNVAALLMDNPVVSFLRKDLDEILAA
jgi:hypothetical protein